MVVNEYACLLVKRGAPEFIASKLAPTGFMPFATLKFGNGKDAPRESFTRKNAVISS